MQAYCEIPTDMGVKEGERIVQCVVAFRGVAGSELPVGYDVNRSIKIPFFTYT